jgi:hypothetical protein
MRRFQPIMTVVLSATEYRLLVGHSPVMIWRSGSTRSAAAEARSMNVRTLRERHVRVSRGFA